MYNDYYLLKPIEAEESEVAYASAQDSFTYSGEVVKTPYGDGTTGSFTGTVGFKELPRVGEKVRFLKGSGEDISDKLKAVKFEDIIMAI